MNNKDRSLELCFQEIVTAAKIGARCPINGTGNIHASLVGILARLGRIKVEVSGRNWRAVTILDGEHAGKRTMADPRGHAVYRIIDRQGGLMIGQEPKPWRPTSKTERQELALAEFREACSRFNEENRKPCVQTSNPDRQEA